MSVTSNILLFQGAVLSAFGLIFVVAPSKIVPLKLDRKAWMIYRILGLWVVMGGFLSASIGWYAALEQQRVAAAGFAVLHAVETLVKVFSGAGSHSLQNVAFTGLLCVAAVL